MSNLTEQLYSSSRRVDFKTIDADPERWRTTVASMARLENLLPEIVQYELTFTDERLPSLDDLDQFERRLDAGAYDDYLCSMMQDGAAV